MSTNSDEKEKRWKGWRGKGFQLEDPVRMFFTIERGVAEKIRELARADGRGEYEYIRNVMMKHVDDFHEKVMRRRERLEALKTGEARE